MPVDLAQFMSLDDVRAMRAENERLRAELERVLIERPLNPVRGFIDPRSVAMVALLNLGEEQRQEVLSKFCRGCGAEGLCYCEADD